jgi:hypothetical protein
LEPEPNLTEISFQILTQLKTDVFKQTKNGCEKKKKSQANCLENWLNSLDICNQ